MFVKKHLVGVFACLLLWYCPVAFAAGEQYGIGDTGPAVEQIQSGLKDSGFFGGKVDGVFSTMTRQAVISFQKAAGLKADGFVEEKTFKALTGKAIPPKPANIAKAAPNRNANRILDTALSYRGVKYRFGGATPSGFDCSGFIYYVFDQMGYGLPRMADGQFEVGIPVSRAALQPGDLVFFSTYEPGPSHVGIYLGNGQFIHASSGAGHVTITSLANPYHRDRYIGARRIIKG